MKHTLKLSCAVLASVACWAFASPGFAQEAPKPMRGSDVAAVDQAPDAKNTWAASRADRKKWRGPSRNSRR